MPDTTEFNASVMLALAHGAKGLMLFSFESFNEVKGIVNNNQKNFTKSHLWYLLKNSIIPRLKGKFGKKLMELDYTGNYIQYFNVNNKQSTPSQENTKVDFLTLSFSQTRSERMNWHCGIFSKPKHPDDKYFLLTNIYTLDDRRDINIQLKVSGTEYKNFRLRNIEDNFDTTFTSQFTSKYNFSRGDGYLYQVAPVVKYGGKLLYSEATKDGMELTDDLIIQNGAVLTINGNYYAKANIIVKNGKVSYKNKGKIHFAQNKRLIKK